MNVIGIDPSLTHTAAFHAVGSSSTELEVRGFAVQSTPKEHVHQVARLVSLRDRLRAELERCAGVLDPPGFAFVEGYAFGAKCAREQLGEWGGQVRLLAHELGWTLVVVPPSTLKAFVCGKGNAKKEQVMLQVYKRWGYEAPDNNAADAFALMQLGIAWIAWRAGAPSSLAFVALSGKLVAWSPAHQGAQQAAVA